MSAATDVIEARTKLLEGHLAASDERLEKYDVLRPELAREIVNEFESREKLRAKIFLLKTLLDDVKTAEART